MQKNRSLAVTIGLVLLIVIVLAAAVGGYLYYQDLQRKSDQKAFLKQAFSDQINNTSASYAKISLYPEAPNRDYIDSFREWIDGYEGMEDNYSGEVSELVLRGSMYMSVLDKDSSDSSNVSIVCDEANLTVRKLNETCQRYETDYISRCAARDNASRLYYLQLNRSNSLYNTAWDVLGSNYTKYGGYKAFLDACSHNISYYNSSIPLVANAGAAYQIYLKGEDYWTINRTIEGMQSNVTKMQQKYADLQKYIPNVTVNMMGDPTMGTDGSKVTTAYHFQVENHNYPMNIWNIVAHFQLLNKGTGTVRSTKDVPVSMSMYISNIYTAVLECDMNGQYDITYTLSYDY